MGDTVRNPVVDAVASAAAQNGAKAGIEAARQVNPHARSIRRLWSAFGVLAVLTVLALGGYVANRSANKATADCQGRLQRNQDAQNVAGAESRKLLRDAAMQQSTSETARAADVLTMLDPAAPPDVKAAAAADFGLQSTLIADAWRVYVTESARADEIRANNPTTFRC